MAKNPKKQISNGVVLTVGIGVILTAGIWIGCVLALVCLYEGFRNYTKGDVAFINGDTQHLANMGNFGSYLQGTTASFWALSGVCLIFVAFLAQLTQLRLQQQELEGQQERLEKQERITSLQNFENSFFQLLNLQNQIASQMRQGRTHYQGVQSTTEWIEGRTCFRIWYENLVGNYTEFSENLNCKKWSSPKENERVVECYEDFYVNRGHQEDLAHYFRTLYHLTGR